MTNNVSEKKKKLPYRGFFVSLIIAAVIYALFSFVPHLNLDFLTYSDVAANAGHSLLYKLVWFIEDFTNAQFYAALFTGIGLLLGAFIAYYLNCKKKRTGGFVIVYNYHIFPWVIASQLLSLIISDLLYTPLLDTSGLTWIPTFIPFVSIPVIVILEYGPNIKNLLTGSILTGILATPMGVMINKYVLSPVGLPVVAANVLTMSLLGILILEVCRYLPWIEKKEKFFSEDPQTYGSKYGEAAPKEDPDKVSWFVRRVFADFTEAQFYGNEWASALMLGGLLIDWIINPASVYYGNAYLPIVLAGQVIASATGIFLYHTEWKKGFYPTFLPIVTIVPGIAGICNGDVFLTLFVAVMGGIIAPPLAAMISSHMPRGWHPMIGNTMSMACCTTLLAIVCKALPYIGIGI